MSATPRTDGMVREVVDAMVSAGVQWDYVVPAEFARQLERELATQMRITTQLIGAIREEFLAGVDRRDDFKWPL